MAPSNVQKLKILHLLRILYTETDPQSGLSMAELISRLYDEGIEAERKSIYRDLETLREFGLNIKTFARAPVEYALIKDGLVFSEIMLLIDTVQSSKFLSESKSRQLVWALKDLASYREQKLLDKRVHVAGRIKNQNESVYKNVDIVHEAMQLKRKISFQYVKYGTDLKRHPRMDGGLYTCSPIRIAFVDGFYYLAAWYEQREKIITFRLDRMKGLSVSDEIATRNKTIRSYANEDFEYQAFEMFDGEPVRISMSVQAAGMDIIVDRFGRDIALSDVDEQQCKVHVTVRMSPLFHGWLASMSGIIELVGPEKAVDAHRNWLSQLLSKLPEQAKE